MPVTRFSPDASIFSSTAWTVLFPFRPTITLVISFRWNAALAGAGWSSASRGRNLKAERKLVPKRTTGRGRMAYLQMCRGRRGRGGRTRASVGGYHDSDGGGSLRDRLWSLLGLECPDHRRLSHIRIDPRVRYCRGL